MRNIYGAKGYDDSFTEDMLEHMKQLIPIEIKANNGAAKSLRTLINSDHYADISFGIKLTGGNISYADHIYTYPYFCAFLLKRCLASQ